MKIRTEYFNREGNQVINPIDIEPGDTEFRKMLDVLRKADDAMHTACTKVTVHFVDNSFVTIESVD